MDLTTRLRRVSSGFSGFANQRPMCCFPFEKPKHDANGVRRAMKVKKVFARGGATMKMNWMNWAQGQRTQENGAVTIFAWERGILYRKGAFVRVLESGRYLIWPFSDERVVVVDVRRANVQVAGQKLLTADQITIALNLVADYEIIDVALALHSVQDFKAQLYEDVQLRTRDVVGAQTVDELLQNRSTINAQIFEQVAALALLYGVRVLAVGIKDVILAPRVRDLLMKEVEAKRIASAMLIGAREEVAAMRALSNAARLAAEHPQLLRLRELDAVRAFAAQGSNTVVWNTSDDKLSLSPNVAARAGAKPSRDEEG
jgi:regulator of protease activity HflC (stomatin/prohibitin superfamily)